MKKLFVSVGLAAMSAAALETAMADSATGPKYWTVGATLRGFYDDNYNIANNGRGSAGIEFEPNISFHVPLQQTDMGIRYTYGLYYYNDRDQLGLNAFDQTHQVDLWVDHAFNERWHSKISDSFAVGQEPELLTPNPVTASATPFRANGDNISNHGKLQLNTDWTRLFTTTLSYDNGFYDYDNKGTVVGSDGLLHTPGAGLNNASLAGLLDRIEQSVSLDLKWHLQRDTTFLIGYQFSWDNYIGDEPISVVNLPAGTFVYHSSDRDSMSHYGYLGLEKDFTPNLTGMFRAGVQYNDVYGDPLFPSTSWDPYADLSLSYTYIPGSYVQLGFTQDTGATDQVQPNSAGHITQYSQNSVLYLSVNHRITSKLSATLIGRVQYTTYQGGAADSNNSTDYGLGLNLSYRINNHFSLDTGYNYDDVVSDITGYSYARNRVYLGVSANY